MEQLTKKKEIVSIFLKNNILVSKTLLEKLSNTQTVDDWHNKLQKGKHPNELLDIDLVQKNSNKHACVSKVKIISEYDDQPKKRSVQDFTDLFNKRYKALHAMLSSRSDLKHLTSISKLRGKKDYEDVSIIGMVIETGETKNGHIIIKIEDLSGQTKIIVKKDNKKVFPIARDIVMDEVIGVAGAAGGEVIFANAIVIPDIPLHSPNVTEEDVYTAVLSCIHVGSAIFEHKKFDNFVKWVNCEEGNEEQRKIAKKLKYIFVCGDIVDGVGIYPGQEKELAILDIKEQYEECARLLSRIRDDVVIILAPGNHDVGRIAEPQPKLNKNYAQSLYDLPNTVLVPNPSMLQIHQTPTHTGIKILMYHGYSFDDYSECVASIKESGAHLSDRAPLVMKFLLSRRHLAPQHKSTLYIPDARYDPLVIQQVPDLFFAGHIHKAGTESYRGTSIIAGSCFQAKTDFQEKVGHDPDPGVVPVVNLKDRSVKMMRF